MILLRVTCYDKRIVIDRSSFQHEEKYSCFKLDGAQDKEAEEEGLGSA